MLAVLVSGLIRYAALVVSIAPYRRDGQAKLTRVFY